VIVPCPSKVPQKESPGYNVPDSNNPLSAVTLCGFSPSLTHYTVVPGATVMSCGSK
jgi:hypothetical protein